MSEPNSTFIYLWINSMLDNYRVEEWSYISGAIPTELVKRYNGTGLVHVESKRIHDPNWKHLEKLIGDEIFDWNKNYAVHLWQRLWIMNESWKNVKTLNASSIQTMNNTFGQIARMIYYNT